jgi:hypothetical protein
MYIPTYDRPSGLVVALCYGDLTWADHSLAVETLVRLDRDGGALPGPLVTVLVVDPESGRPSSQMCNDDARARSRLAAPRHLHLVVSTCAVARGIATAAKAQRPSTGRFEAEAFASFGLAVQHAERAKGHSLPRLYSLLAEAQRRRNEVGGAEKVSAAMPRAQDQSIRRTGSTQD